MPEVHDPKKEPERKRHFITEKIVKQPMSRKQVLKRLVLGSACAALFGAVAAISFAFSVPVAERFFGEEPTEESISIPKDVPSETTEAPTQPPESQTEAESEPVRDLVREAVESYRFTVDDLNKLFNSLRAQVQKANKGIVVVHSVQQDMDWFDNPVETSGQFAGAVIAKTAQEILIMTPEGAVEQADSIKVTLPDGSEVDGRMKQKDSISGMAIVSISLEGIDSGVSGQVAVLPLGNSYQVHEGDLVVALGGPAGLVRSVDYGFVSYISKNTQMVDRINRVLYTDLCADTGLGTFLINTSGELIGWAMEPRPERDGSQVQITKVMGISDYKAILEKLTNGLGAPYFGIEGQEVSEAMAEQGRPRGIYVTNSVVNGPAYSVGIQNGDIITKVNDRELTSMVEFQNMMDDLECGQLLHVTVQRNGRQEYTELTFQVTVGAR